MNGRDQNGRFAPGNKASCKANGGNGGRRSRETEHRYLELLREAVSEKDFREIVERAIEDAQDGDAQARKVLFDYLLGAPVQRVAPTDPSGEYEWNGDLGELVGELDQLLDAARARAAEAGGEPAPA